MKHRSPYRDDAAARANGHLPTHVAREQAARSRPRKKKRGRAARGRDARRAAEERGQPHGPAHSYAHPERRLSTAEMMAGLREFQRRVHEWATRKGWVGEGVEEQSFAEAIGNMHAELSEAFEEYRSGQPLTRVYSVYQKHGGGTHGGPLAEIDWPEGELRMLDLHDRLMKPEGIPVEIADAMYRGFQWFGARGLDAAWVLVAKLLYNETRPRRHGGKRC